LLFLFFFSFSPLLLEGYVDGPSFFFFREMQVSTHSRRAPFSSFLLQAIRLPLPPFSLSFFPMNPHRALPHSPVSARPIVRRAVPPYFLSFPRTVRMIQTCFSSLFFALEASLVVGFFLSSARQNERAIPFLSSFFKVEYRQHGQGLFLPSRIHFPVPTSPLLQEIRSALSPSLDERVVGIVLPYFFLRNAMRFRFPSTENRSLLFFFSRWTRQT